MKPCMNKECKYFMTVVNDNCDALPSGDLDFCKHYQPEKNELEEMLDRAITKYTMNLDGDKGIDVNYFKLKALLKAIIQRIDK